LLYPTELQALLNRRKQYYNAANITCGIYYNNFTSISQSDILTIYK
jgi:hypothetical protein